jgi:hypothetical protein
MYPVDLFHYLNVLVATNGFAPNENNPPPTEPVGVAENSGRLLRWRREAESLGAGKMGDG